MRTLGGATSVEVHPVWLECGEDAKKEKEKGADFCELAFPSTSLNILICLIPMLGSARWCFTECWSGSWPCVSRCDLSI